MIAMLTGILAHREDPYLIIDVNGVGYRVLATSSVLRQVQNIGDLLKVYTYLNVREDALDLYAFSDPKDLKLFEYLLGVSGIGPKSAIGIFSLGTRSEIIQAISKGDASFFTGVSRLGLKNAQKIIIELKSKLGGVGSESLELSGEEFSGHDEAIAALQAIGFARGEAYRALRQVVKEGLSTSEIIRLALKQLGK